MAYRVDNIPLLLRPGFELWGNTAGISIYQLLVHQQRSMTLELSDYEKLGNRPAIFVIWHENLIPLFLSMRLMARHRNQIWMNHPLWYMKPVHVFLKRLGVNELCLGSTGHHGQQALHQLAARLLATGASTSMAVDGPKGPPYHLRKGCIHLAMKTGYPIIPLCFKISETSRIGFNWDRKFWPHRNAHMTVHVGEPLEVAPDADTEIMGEILSTRLNAHQHSTL